MALFMNLHHYTDTMETGGGVHINWRKTTIYMYLAAENAIFLHIIRLKTAIYMYSGISADGHKR